MTKTTASDPVTLILGGTGKTGRRLAARLGREGRKVRLGSRIQEPPFDWNNQSTWVAALEGVTAAYIAYQPDLAAPGALETVSRFLDTAIQHDVRKLVLLSGRGEPEAEQAEDKLRQTDVDWTILRSSWFCQNFDEGFFLQSIVAGKVVLPSGLAAEPFVDVEDIADIALRALTDQGCAGQLYEITGPRSITFAEAITYIADASGRQVALENVSLAEYRANLLQYGVPIEEVDLIIYLFATVLDGRNVSIANGVERALGRPPRNFEDYVKRTVTHGVWGGQSA